MKILLLTIICVGLVVLTVGNWRSNSSRATNEPAVIVAENIQQDQAKEWDPSKEGIGDLTEGPRTESTVPKDKRKPINIVRRLFRPEEFAAFVKKTVFPEFKKQSQWKPEFIVLHHTGVPSIKQRPSGFTTNNMDLLAKFYGIEKGWRSGPHLFVDQNGIWVFSPLEKRGTHSPSWNNRAWGIEQLGNFINEAYDSGPGQKIQDNALAALAILSLARNLEVETLHFHLEDPLTDHRNCPGAFCDKDQVKLKLKAEIEKWRPVWNSL